MSRLTTLGLLAVGCLLSEAAAPKAAVAGETFTIYYRMHEVPDDPTSRVTLVVRTSLVAEHPADSPYPDNWCAWRVADVQIREIGVTGKTESAWAQADPPIDTEDGLWWVKHSDVTDPKLKEFSGIPELEGTATTVGVEAGPIHVSGIGGRPSVLLKLAQQLQRPLNYKLKGVAYVPPQPPVQPPYTPTFALTYQFETADGGKFWHGAHEPVAPGRADLPQQPGDDFPPEDDLEQLVPPGSTVVSVRSLP